MPKKQTHFLPFDCGFPLFVPLLPKPDLIKLSKIRISDIWGFWDYLIKNHANKHGKISGNFLPTLLEQAKYFYQAAERAPMKSQPLLYYYSFLNLAKIVVNLYYPSGKSVEYYHGIETKVNDVTTLDTATVTFKQYGGIGSTKISVAKEFLTILGDSIVVPQQTKIKDMLASCIGIHRTFSETYSQKETFYRLMNAQCVERQGKKVTYRTEVGGLTEQIMNDLIAAKGYNLTKEGTGDSKKFWYTEVLNMVDYTLSPIRWRMLAHQIVSKGIWTYTDGNQYRLYISKDALPMTSPSLIYCIMFFFGSITRYHPYFFESILNAKEQWLISEFLNTQPMQFMYNVTSKVVGKYIFKSRTDSL